jgi:hypothetical protein
MQACCAMHIITPLTAETMSLPRKLLRASVWFVGGTMGLVFLAFVIDYGVFRVRVVTGRRAFGSVVVRHYYAVLKKNGKTEFMFDPPAPWKCVNSLFPHEGSSPCWYLTRHPEQRTDI